MNYQMSLIGATVDLCARVGRPCNSQRELKWLGNLAVENN